MSHFLYVCLAEVTSPPRGQAEVGFDVPFTKNSTFRKWQFYKDKYIQESWLQKKDFQFAEDSF